jgi:hypothetical protein
LSPFHRGRGQTRRRATGSSTTGSASLMSYFCGGIALSMQKGQTVGYAMIAPLKKWVHAVEKWKSPVLGHLRPRRAALSLAPVTNCVGETQRIRGVGTRKLPP